MARNRTAVIGEVTSGILPLAEHSGTDIARRVVDRTAQRELGTGRARARRRARRRVAASPEAL
jgi:hypothetical protein